jgi:ABC-type nitrate/sulfonate/bicarbonate transport system permease component
VTRRLGSLGLELWLPVTAVAAWWFLSEDSTSPFFPPLRRIVQAFEDNWVFERVDTDLLPSLGRFGAGLAIAVVAGVVVGLLLGLWTPARRATAPVVDFLRSIPAPALISIMILLLGFGNGMKVSAIAFASFFPILLNTIDGVRGVEPQQLDMARAYKLSAWQRITKIVLPAATPQIFAGLRISLAVALLVMAFSEMFASTNGLGFFILFAQETYRIPDMWSGIVMLGLVGYAVNLGFLLVERRALRWHRGWRATARDAGGGA